MVTTIKEMKKSNYNMFGKSHLGLSHLLFETGIKIGKTNFNNVSEAGECISLILKAVKYYKYHTSKENEIIYGTIQPFAPYIIVMMKKINAEGLSIASGIEQIIFSFNREFTRMNMIELGIELQSLIISFTSVVLQLMKKENTILNELLNENFDEYQMLDLQNRINNQFLPEESEWYLAYIEKGLRDSEITGWLDRILNENGVTEAGNLAESLNNRPFKTTSEMNTPGFDMQRA